ncbi:tyrosine-type recombinase/integrase [Nocardioides sp. SOB77]|uniref:Tyrosine-type recombinase/integrase n=1 Tax=Nocardioides oceani TaxID=3058369 RepID=A0ABT8FJB3_9ACTN|nr:tyrosine-type recombinase/integrase [Nocardioides oceani]MDN4174763.1 tyrosine-type recombinase/integrase [Nocardioides oceani]
MTAPPTFSTSGLDPMATLWLEHMTRERVPANTVKARLSVLRSVGNPGTATREEVEAWWATRSHLKETTRSANLAHLRSFYRWAARWDHRADDPTLRLDAPKIPTALPHPASRAEVMKLLDTLEGELRRAVALGAFGGMRVAEAAVADWADIDLESRRIRVHGKGQKERLIALSPTLYDAIGPPCPGDRGNIVTAGGEPYTPDVLQRKVNRAIKAADVDGTFHWLRHRAATVGLAATNGNLLAVARFLGHESVATTTRYAATSDEDLDVIAEAIAR